MISDNSVKDYSGITFEYIITEAGNEGMKGAFYLGVGHRSFFGGVSQHLSKDRRMLPDGDGLLWQNHGKEGVWEVEDVHRSLWLKAGKADRLTRMLSQGHMCKAVMCVPCLKLRHLPRKELSLHKDVCGLAVALVRSGKHVLVIYILQPRDVEMLRGFIKGLA